MAAGTQVLVRAVAVSVLVVNFAAVQGEGSTGTIAALTCPPAAPNVAAKAGPGGEAPSLLEGQVTLPGSTIQLKCPSNEHTFLPLLSSKAKLDDQEAAGDQEVVTTVYADQEGKTSEELHAAIPGATGTKKEADDKKNAVLMLDFPQLPPATKTIYLQCATNKKPKVRDGEDGGGNNKPVCVFAVTVTSAPPQGPQSCAVPGTTVLLGISGEGSSTQFSCGSTMKLSPKDEKKVYSEDCVKEEDLKNMTLTPPGGSTQGYYTLTATKNPPMKTICYKCEPEAAAARGETNKNCVIKIALRGGSRLTARSLFGLVLPCVLALLHFS